MNQTLQRRLSAWRKRHLSRRRLALGVIALVAAAASCQLVANRKTPELSTVLVTRGDIEKTVTAVGSLKPKDYVDVGTQISGRVEKVHVEIGDQVKAGEPIAEIDSRTYESTVRKDEAELQHLKAQLGQQFAEQALAREQLARNKRMLQSHAVSQSAVDEAEAALKVADATVAASRAQIKAAEATLEGSRTNLGYTKIYAPMAGTVVSQETLEGQTVNAVQSAPVIVQVANLDVMTVWAQVAEADVSKIRPGMAAHFTTLGAPDERWTGKVRQIQPTPEIENDVVLYNVLIDVENKNHELLPEMTVQVFLMLGRASDVPLVALNALQAQDQNAGRYSAQVLTSRGIEVRNVEVGLANRRLAQVRSGLSIGERVVVPTAAPAGEARPERAPGPPTGPRL